MLTSQYLHVFIIQIVMEYLDTCLADIITNDDPELCQLPLSERQIAYILKQILLALEHIHSCGRMHRDIRADNILLNADGLIKLGMSRRFM
jgi:serine/threonine protein kinase